MSSLRVAVLGVLLCTGFGARAHGNDFAASTEASSTVAPDSLAECETATTAADTRGLEPSPAVMAALSSDGSDQRDGRGNPGDSDDDGSSKESSDSSGLEAGDDDFDDFEDVAFHPRLSFSAEVSPEPKRPTATELARVRARLEDRRCEKPPRA